MTDQGPQQVPSMNVPPPPGAPPRRNRWLLFGGLGCLGLLILLFGFIGCVALIGSSAPAPESPADNAPSNVSDSQEAEEANPSSESGDQTALIRVGGTSGVRFEGSIGNLDSTRSVNGVVPAEFEVEYDADALDFDSVYVDFYKSMDNQANYDQGELSVQIVVDGQVVQETSSSAQDGYVSLNWTPGD